MKHCEVLIYVLCALLLVSAGVSLGGGLYLIVGFNHINQNILPTFDDAKANIQLMIKTMNLYAATNFSNPPDVTQSNPLADINLEKIFQGFGYYFTALCVALVALSVVTIAGVCWKSKRLNYTCILLTAALLVTETTSLLLHTSLRRVINGFIRDFFWQQLNNSFKSIRSHDYVSIGWNLIMQKFNCCGIDGYKDFNSFKSFDDVWAEPGHTVTENHRFKTALACCNSIYIKLTPYSERFTGPCLEKDYLYKRGCLDVFWDVADKYKEALIACIIIAMGIQVLLVIINCAIMKVSTRNHISNQVTSSKKPNRTRKNKNGQHKSDNVDSIQKNMSSHEIRENAWLQETHSQSDQNSEIVSSNINQIEPISTEHIEQKWYDGSRELPMQKPTRW